MENCGIPVTAKSDVCSPDEDGTPVEKLESRHLVSCEGREAAALRRGHRSRAQPHAVAKRVPAAERNYAMTRGRPVSELGTCQIRFVVERNLFVLIPEQIPSR